ncbi:sigma 54-interacting transcriptional regulator [Stigmatella aurantiaca]|uniref:Sigma-54 dependent transcriptional regulator, Fis family n=1 Tax=Stigmatella aurantiaca (strain DW4/3-1) TaxID=378806 RepID=Q090J9_STIAD|nr:sigma 54-interacting transcriptional regulator [Stigmatella aurantiaca]ADO73451.1 Sigma-54 dependent transcriptional regulator, Fis family [Stigmatella aurantiaca DW4/3-1]EAU66169.1 two component, sigma54 specific, transcriptional regulator, Fis family [Stigmatella aurantiaca DW4/3-1]
MTDKPEITQSVQVESEGRPVRIQVREWTVEVSAGPDKSKKLTTQDSLVRVGSDPSSDLVLTDPTVSRRHLEIERTPKGLLLKDLGSRNGTYLDGRQVFQVLLQSGDKVQLGKTRLTIKPDVRTTEVEVPSGADSFGSLVGTSERMRLVFSDLRRIAREDMNLLIEGETGTGKELAARAVHQHSSRRHGPFKVVDCNLITEEKAERELFGSMRAVDDGDKGVRGVFEAAQGGTLFLDEVGELPLALQPKLLRVLERREVPTLDGGAVPVNVRVIASTHRNLEEDVRQGRFRADLYFRLAVARVRLPPLRTRREDIPVLSQSLLDSLKSSFELTPQTLALFEGYEWPGNVRELRNVLERGALMQETGNTSWLDFMAQPPQKNEGPPPTSVGALVTGMNYHEAKDRVLADFERLYFAEVMKEVGFDMKTAEQRTGLSMQSLYRLLKKNGLRLKDLKNAEGLDK